MSASIERWQLVHMSARASALFVSYRPHFFKSASCVLVAARSLAPQPLVVCGAFHFSDGPWHALQLTPSARSKPLPRCFSGALVEWQLRHRASVASILSASAIFVLASSASCSCAFACRSPPDHCVNSASVVAPAPSLGSSAPWHLTLE